MYPSVISDASSNWKDLHAWKYCSLVLPNLKYCCLNLSRKPCQVYCCCWTFKVTYHKLAYSISVKQNLLTFWSSGKSCITIQFSFLKRCASTSSLGFPEKSGLKWDQFNWLFTIGAGGCTSNGLELPGSWGGSTSPAGMCTGGCGPSTRTSAGWSDSCSSLAGASAGGLGSWGKSVGNLWGWFGEYLLLNLLSLSLLLPLQLLYQTS